MNILKTLIVYVILKPLPNGISLNRSVNYVCTPSSLQAFRYFHGQLNRIFSFILKFE